MLVTFMIQPKIEPHIQNFEISKFELFVLKCQKYSILFFWDLGHYLGPKVQQIDHWVQNLCQNPDHHSMRQVLQSDACRWFGQQNTACSKFEQAVLCHSNHPKSKNFDKKWSKSEQAKSEPPKSKQPKSEKLKFPQITASSMELFFTQKNWSKAKLTDWKFNFPMSRFHDFVVSMSPSTSTHCPNLDADHMGVLGRWQSLAPMAVARVRARAASLPVCLLTPWSSWRTRNVGALCQRLNSFLQFAVCSSALRGTSQMSHLNPRMEASPDSHRHERMLVRDLILPTSGEHTTFWRT